MEPSASDLVSIAGQTSARHPPAGTSSAGIRDPPPWGWGDRTLSGEDSGRRGGRDDEARAERKPGDRDLGHALRTVYIETVKEDIPAELLDLLGKLD